MIFPDLQILNFGLINVHLSLSDRAQFRVYSGSDRAVQPDYFSKEVFFLVEKNTDPKTQYDHHEKMRALQHHSSDRSSSVQK